MLVTVLKSFEIENKVMSKEGDTLELPDHRAVILAEGGYVDLPKKKKAPAKKAGKK